LPISRRANREVDRPCKRFSTVPSSARSGCGTRSRHILIGGLTWKHDALLKAAFESAAYRVQVMPIPDVAAIPAGEGVRQQRSVQPTYFMVGHLIKFLQSLESNGMSRQDIIDRYVFFTAGSCGPCRFGMYEAEYRLAVQNAGFDGFRVLLFQTDGRHSRRPPGEPG
jgi:predicted nucleotide-binding protein (sugar kinase/HSP70/actin superfamily)